MYDPNMRVNNYSSVSVNIPREEMQHLKAAVAGRHDLHTLYNRLLDAENSIENPDHQAYRGAVEDVNFGGADTDLDDIPAVSVGDKGAYVSTWVWIADDAAGLEAQK
jgi:hypothetical protein